jgi:hypothetical protein
MVWCLHFVADLLYKASMNTGSVLEYALAFTSAALDKYCSKWSAAPKTGFIDITTSKDFYRIYSGLQIVRNDLLQFIFIITSHLGNISEQ